MKSKTRRKLTFRRFAYYLLIAAIVVSCVANGIFAKFTTEDDGGDGARVAKFGIVLSVAGDLFSTTYNAYAEDGTGNETSSSNMPTVFKEVATDDGISVQAHYKYVQNGEEVSAENLNTSADYSFNNVVAPGTKNDEGINISIQGTAETDCVISYEIAMETIFLRNIIPANGYTAVDDFQYSYTSNVADTKVNYCIMVPMKENIIREDNFEEFKDTLYTAETAGDVTTYTKATGVFDSDEDYYQAEDVIDNITNDYYIPIIYYVDGTSSLSGIEDASKAEWNLPWQYDYEYNEIGAGKSTNIIDLFVDGVIGSYFLTGNESIYNKDAEDVFPYKCVSKGTSGIIETGKPIDIDFSVKWLWEYTGEEDTYRDQADTILGHLMAGNDVYKTTDDGDNYVKAVEGEDYNLDIAFDIDITVNQVD